MSKTTKSPKVVSITESLRPGDEHLLQGGDEADFGVVRPLVNIPPSYVNKKSIGLRFIKLRTYHMTLEILKKSI